MYRNTFELTIHTPKTDKDSFTVFFFFLVLLIQNSKVSFSLKWGTGHRVVRCIDWSEKSSLTNRQLDSPRCVWVHWGTYTFQTENTTSYDIKLRLWLVDLNRTLRCLNSSNRGYSDESDIKSPRLNFKGSDVETPKDTETVQVIIRFCWVSRVL